jgi:hypothetical protein
LVPDPTKCGLNSFLCRPIRSPGAAFGCWLPTHALRPGPILFSVEALGLPGLAQARRPAPRFCAAAVRSVFISVSRARVRSTLLLPNRAAVAIFLSVRKGSAPPLFGCSISLCGFPYSGARVRPHRRGVFLSFPEARRLVPGSSIPRAGSLRRHVPIVFSSRCDSVPCFFSLGLGFGAAAECVLIPRGSAPPPAGGFTSRWKCRFFYRFSSSSKDPVHLGFLSRFSSLGCSKRRNRLTGFAASDLPHSVPARHLHAARLAHRSSWASLFFVSSSEHQFSACLPHRPRPSLFKPRSSLLSGSSLSNVSCTESPRQHCCTVSVPHGLDY